MSGIHLSVRRERKKKKQLPKISEFAVFSDIMFLGRKFMTPTWAVEGQWLSLFEKYIYE